MAEVVQVNKLKPIAERILRLEDTKAEASEMLKEVYAEAKNDGFDPKALKQAIADIRNPKPKDEDYIETVDLYKDAIR